MSEPRLPASLRFEPRPSRLLQGLLLVAHGGALLLLTLLPSALWARLLLGCVVGVSLAAGIAFHARRRGKRAIVAVFWDSSGIWTLRTADGRELEAQLLPGSYVTPHLIILNFRLDGWWRRRSLILLPDSLDVDSLRRLRIRLLHGPGQRPE